MNRLTKMIVAASAMLPLAAMARSILYYYDFDTIQNGSLVYTNSTDHADINKGSGTAEFHKSASSGATIPCTTDGAFGSSGAFCATSKNTIWLGDGSTSLGCSTTNGFSLSFWLKATSSHTAWRDFLGFTVGGENYWLAYESGTSSDFSIWRPKSNSSSECVSTNDVTGSRLITQAADGEWKHVAFVFAPGTNSLGLCAIYVGGEKVGSMKVVSAGSLSRVCVGPLVAAWNNAERNASSSGNATQTGIDELAVFDYPATAEQVKWLAKHRPAQPAKGPGREMPICFLLDDASESDIGTGTGIQATNSGTGPWTATKWTSYYAKYIYGGTLGSPRAFEVGSNKTTFKIESNEADGFGATLGSGMTLSFWINAPASVAKWKDFMGFRLGNRYEYFEWNGASPAKFKIYGTTSSNNDISLVDSTWQHVAMIWNAGENRFDLYLNGAKSGCYVEPQNASLSEALKILTIGNDVMKSETEKRSQNSATAIWLDDVAVFNQSLSPAQISWLGENHPALPPLDATNLVRTVSADCSWAGGLASWGVKEWNGEAWADTTRTMIYPALEDTEVETAVAFASGATITNDTFVTPKRLSLSNASGGASVAPTLVCAEGSLFAPESMEIGDGVTLNVSAPFGDPVSAGTLTFGEGTKIVFDSEVLLASDPDEKEWKTVMTFGSVVLPSGEANVLSHFGVSNGKYALKLSDDDKSVLAKRTRGFIIAVF